MGEVMTQTQTTTFLLSYRLGHHRDRDRFTITYLNKLVEASPGKDSSFQPVHGSES